jgi:crotonobetainyl-CoA:carnitine CoA-transferase CaiB-like acyl-CoA transferase
MKAYDLLIQCETGLASITGGPDSPGRVGVSVADIGCGMNAHAAILEALYDRERTGKGRAISTSLFDGLAGRKRGAAPGGGQQLMGCAGRKRRASG